jgi:hypothetical protein
MKNDTKAFIGMDNEPKNENVLMGVQSCLRGVIAQENNIRMNTEAKARLTICVNVESFELL